MAAEFDQFSGKFDRSTLQVLEVLSEEEAEVLRIKYKSFNVANKRALPMADAVKLFRDDYPDLSEWEMHELVRKCDLNNDGFLSLDEYLRAYAFHKLLLESNNEVEVFRSFVVLDTNGDGRILKREVLDLIDQSNVAHTGVLRQVIEKASFLTNPVAREGDDIYVSFEEFNEAIRDINRKVDREIATKKVRLHGLMEAKNSIAIATGASLSIESAASTPRSVGSTQDDKKHRAQVHAKKRRDKGDIEMQVLWQEIERLDQDRITSSNRSLGAICEKILSTYSNEKFVYESLRNLLQYFSLDNASVMRGKMELNGKKVNVLDVVLHTASAQLKKTKEYQELHNFSIPSFAAMTMNGDREDPGSTPRSLFSSRSTPRSVTSPRMGVEEFNNSLLSIPLVRHIFAFYCITGGNVTNFESMSRMSFMNFVRDCELRSLGKVPMTDPELNKIFTQSIQNQNSSNMTLHGWVQAIQLLFQRALNRSTEIAHKELCHLTKKHIIPKAKSISNLKLAPDVSQRHVLKLIKEHLWSLKQIFCHFAGHSLTEIDPDATMTLRDFMVFARSFGILRASTANAKTAGWSADESSCRRFSLLPISLMELVQEFCCAKLDVGFSNEARREASDLSFREFLRCLQRVAVTMRSCHLRFYALTDPLDTQSATAVFDLGRDEDQSNKEARRTPELSTPLVTPKTPVSVHKRRHNLVASNALTQSGCRTTSNRVVWNLLQRSDFGKVHPPSLSRELSQVSVPGLRQPDDQQQHHALTESKAARGDNGPRGANVRVPPLLSHDSFRVQSIPKVVYRQSSAGPNTPWIMSPVVHERVIPDIKAEISSTPAMHPVDRSSSRRISGVRVIRSPIA